MSQAHAIPAPPAEPAWDITFTRLARAVGPHLDACALDLGACAMVDMRLLDACGDIVADDLASGMQGTAFHEVSAAVTLISESLARAATTAYVAALAHVELLRPLARSG